MFDIGFSELLLVMVIGLVVLGPERLPVAVRTVAGWIRALRSLAASVQNELTQELKLQELQDSLKKAEQAGLQNLTPELKASMDELKEAAESMKRSYHPNDLSEPSGAAPGASAQAKPAQPDPEALHDDAEHGVSRAPVSAPVSKSPDVSEEILPAAEDSVPVPKTETPAPPQSTTSDR